MSTTLWVCAGIASHLIVAVLALWYGKLHPSAAAKIVADAGKVVNKI